MRVRDLIFEAVTRRGFLKGLAAATAALKIQGSIPSGVNLLQKVSDHLDQWSGEDDDDYYDAYQEMAGELGFEDDPITNDFSQQLATEKMSDLLDLFRDDPQKASMEFLKHLRSQKLEPKDIKSDIFHTRAGDPNDWRYQQNKKDRDAQKIEKSKIEPMRVIIQRQQKEKAAQKSREIASQIIHNAARHIRTFNPTEIERVFDKLSKISKLIPDQTITQTPTVSDKTIDVTPTVVPDMPALPPPSLQDIETNFIEIFGRDLTDEEKVLIKQEYDKKL